MSISAVTLCSLANETLQAVAQYLGDRDISNLTKTNRCLNGIFISFLSQRALMGKPPRVRNVPALTWAIQYGHNLLVEKIVSQPGFDQYKEGIRDALHEAAELGHSDIIKTLVGAGFEVDSWDEKGQCPLHLAAANGRPIAAQTLLDFGAHIAARNNKRKTAFSLAIHSPRDILRNIMADSESFGGPTDRIAMAKEVEARVVSTLRVLVDNGARQEITMKDQRGDTPLHDSVYRGIGFSGGPEIVVGSGVLRYLVENGASIYERNNQGMTPVELAVLYDTRNVTALNFFLGLGVSPNQMCAGQNCNSLLKSSVAWDQGAYDVIQILCGRGARADDIDLLSFFSDAEDPDCELFDRILTLLLLQGASFNGTESQCFTCSVAHGNLTTMKMLFESGADINVMASCNSADGTPTPIELALLKKSNELIQFLVDRNVRMSAEQKLEAEQILGTKV